MLNWFKNLFLKQWEVQPCGCKYYQGCFTPLEVERCPKHEQEFQEWLKKQPPEPPKDDYDPNIYFIG